jgi:hypothetical protein
VRYPKDETPPAWPSFLHGRYQWDGPPGTDLDRDRRALHEGIQEHGAGLWLVWCPLRRKAVVIEAYRPWELPGYYRKPKRVKIPKDPGNGSDPITIQPDDHGNIWVTQMLNPLQYEDAKDGLLIALEEIRVLEGPITRDDLVEIRAGNRAARRHFAYYVAPDSHRSAEYHAKVVAEEKRRRDQQMLELAMEMAEVAEAASKRFPQVPVAVNI